MKSRIEVIPDLVRESRSALEKNRKEEIRSQVWVMEQQLLLLLHGAPGAKSSARVQPRHPPRSMKTPTPFKPRSMKTLTSFKPNSTKTPTVFKPWVTKSPTLFKTNSTKIPTPFKKDTYSVQTLGNQNTHPVQTPLTKDANICLNLK